MLIRFVCFSGLLAGVAKVSDHTKCISLSNQPCMTRSALIHPEEPYQWLLSHPILVDVMKVLILLMTFQVKYAFKIEQNI